MKGVVIMFWWDVRETIIEIGYGILKLFKKLFTFIFGVIISILGFVKHLIFKILCLLFPLSVILFIVGIYFAYKCFIEMKNGIPFLEMKNLTYVLWLIGIPIVLFILTVIFRPKD